MLYLSVISHWVTLIFLSNARVFSISGSYLREYPSNEICVMFFSEDYTGALSWKAESHTGEMGHAITVSDHHGVSLGHLVEECALFLQSGAQFCFFPFQCGHWVELSRVTFKRLRVVICSLESGASMRCFPIFTHFLIHSITY